MVFTAGVFLFTRYGSFIIFKLGRVISVLFRKNRDEGISPLRTALLALASTLGVGNIVGVSTAVFSGGPGAVFWMTVSAFAAMPLKYGEVVLSMVTRVSDGNEYRGGAMYYIRDLIKSPFLASAFALLCTFSAVTVGNIVQVSAVARSFEREFSISPLLLGILGAFAVYLSLRRGTKGVAFITSRLVPLASIIFSSLSVYIILTNIGRLPEVLSLIMKSAFNIRSLFGGVGGYTLMRALRYGVARGILSNEAGCGTSPIAHAKSNLSSPAEQGFWGLFEVFADTVVMCNLTAFVILLSYEELAVAGGLNGMELVLAAFGKYAGEWAEPLIAVSVFLFGYATVISQGFYGAECMSFLTKSRRVEKAYALIYCTAVVYGAVAGDGIVWGVTDITVSVMTFINTACLISASGVIKRETDAYFGKKRPLASENKRL